MRLPDFAKLIQDHPSLKGDLRDVYNISLTGLPSDGHQASPGHNNWNTSTRVQERQDAAAIPHFKKLQLVDDERRVAGLEAFKDLVQRLASDAA